MLGCGSPQPAATTTSQSPSTPPPAETPPPKRERVTDRPGNPDGVVFIVEYHRIEKKEARWDRSVDRFKADLERLYRMGFRPVTLSQYLDDAMDLPPGASPVVFTWDDSDPTQFRLLDDGSIDPECGVGIWKAFAERHPDFPVRGNFYILPQALWGQPGLIDKKLAMMKDWGCEIGSHSWTHANLKKLPAEKVKEELARAQDFIQGKGFDCTSIALPYGISPQDPSLIKSFTYNGKTYTHRAALLVGANPAPSPKSPKLDPYRLPRIQSIEGDFGITYWLDKVEKGEVKPYVEP